MTKGQPTDVRTVEMSAMVVKPVLGFDPDAQMPRINRGMVYLGACLIAGTYPCGGQVDG